MRAVRVVTEVTPVDRAFDYLLTDATSTCGVGDRVRIDFNNRSVRGWVTEIVDPDPTLALKPINKWLGYGPPPTLISLLEWASARWCSPLSRFLVSTSPSRLVTNLPASPTKAVLDSAVMAGANLIAPGVLQCAPTIDPISLILGAYESTRESPGSLLVLVPNEAWANRLRVRLEQRGCAVACGDTQWDRMRSGWPVIVGSRGAAFSPTPKICGAVIIDADDEAYRSEAAPTWNAFDVLRERCARDQAPLWATSMIPSPELLDGSEHHVSGDLASGWPRLEVVDRRTSDPRDGVLARESFETAHRALASDEEVAVVVVLQRLGTGRIFACRRCGELARCEVCGQAEIESDEMFACVDRHEPRANFCRACGATNLKRVRIGVTTLARDISNQLSQEVTEVTSKTPPGAALARVVVGTEAVWQRVRRCATVIFVDFDQYLLAPRSTARREAIAAVGKAGRLVGSRKQGRGEVVVQTRRGDDLVIRALRSGDFSEIIADDIDTARILGLPPFGAVGEVSGDAASHFVAQLDQSLVRVLHVGDRYSLRAADINALTKAVREVPRPPGRLRVAIH